MWLVVDGWPWEGCGSAEMVLELTNLFKLCILSGLGGKSCYIWNLGNYLYPVGILRYTEQN